MDGSSAPVSQASVSHASPRYRAYVLALLIAVGVVGWVDRNVFAVLLQSIKVEFALSDTSLGLLGGVAFGVFYAALGLPVAWLADRYDRRALLAGALALWSAFTAACSLATGAVSLFLTRVAVGIGEAGGAPPAVSLVADYFPRERRAFALGLLYLYIPLGFVVGYLLGGWLNELVGWRAACLWLGLPGVALAVLVRLTLREPPRSSPNGALGARAAPALLETVRYFVSRPALRHIPLGGAAHGAGAFAAAIWLPAYFMRTFGMSSAEAGACLAVAYGVGGTLGVCCGGYVADAIVARTRDDRWYALWPVVLLLVSVPVTLALYLAATPAVAVAALLASALLGHAFLGPVAALLQNLAGPQRRAVAAALYLFLVNLVSMGLGPVAVGYLSDTFTARLGLDALRYALLAIVTGTTLLAALHFWLSACALRRQPPVPDVDR
jgi:predicted MFS family arabinose efflux permease